MLPEIDRLEMNHLLADLALIQQRLQELEKVIAVRCGSSDDADVAAQERGKDNSPVLLPLTLPSPQRGEGTADSYFSNGP